MGCSWPLVLGFVLNVAHSLETQGSGSEQTLVISDNITAVLGQEVYLSCRYLGESRVQNAEWKRQINSRSKFKRLAGFSNGSPFSRDDFSVPDSPTNLTVRMKVSGLDAEGKYICEFEEEEENIFDSMFVTVLAQPDIQITVTAETINDTHYQSVSCSADGGRPEPQISWLVGGHPPSDFPFTVKKSKTLHSNGTSTLSSSILFPTHLQDEEHVTCVVQHLTLPNPKLTTARVETYARPNVNITAEMIEQEGSDFWVVSCISSGGRPDTEISLALNVTEELQREKDSDSDTQRLSIRLPAAEHEGRSISCMFKHPKFSRTETRGIRLPTFYLSGDQFYSGNGSSDDPQTTEFIELVEGGSDVNISLRVRGNVPRCNAICRKDDGLLPEDVTLIGRSLIFQGLMNQMHDGLYECDFSYHHIKTTLRFNITVKPQGPPMVPPIIRVDSNIKDGRWVVECLASGGVPAANMSWLLPEGVSGDFWFDSISNNGSHCIRGVLRLPVCSPRELAAQCVINHPAFAEPQNRSLTLPPCARPNITISIDTEWKDGHKYTEVLSSVVGVASAADINWRSGNSNRIRSVTETEVLAEGLVSTRSVVRFLSSLYAGQNLTCTVKHPSLETPEERTINIPVHKPPQLSVSVVRQQVSPLWLAVCDCKGECVGTNLTWALPENARGETFLHTEREGRVMKARLTYQFPLAAHEGQDLTCVYHLENGITEKKVVHIPKYYISSVRVLNHTTPLQSRYSGQPVTYRVSVQENQHHRNILLRVEGNVPEYNLDCRRVILPAVDSRQKDLFGESERKSHFHYEIYQLLREHDSSFLFLQSEVSLTAVYCRSDGWIVQLDGAVMVLHSDPSGRIKGLYTCLASFYHHKAFVNIQVEVTSEDEQFFLVTLICVSSASAILLILVVILCVCCRKRNGKTPHKQRESISALTSLMQEPGSPEVRKPGTEDSKEYAQLTTFSIVFDVKSTV